MNGLDKTVSNTYTAGAKQTFVPSLSTSGINVTPGTLPTNAAAGDVAIDSGDANKLKVYDGAQWNTLISLSNYTTTFTAATLVTVNGTTHRLGTANLIVDCYDNATPVLAGGAGQGGRRSAGVQREHLFCERADAGTV